MELNLFQKNSQTWTRVKLSNSEMAGIPKNILKALGEPMKKSSRYTYYEVEGDLLNGKE